MLVSRYGALHSNTMKTLPRFPVRRTWPFAVALATIISGGAFALNDTGTTLCYTNATNLVACSAAITADSGTHPRQDSRFGRDANPSPGKVGGGAAGFDYTKISNSGNALPASTALGSGPNDWACTRDNVTGLLWEVKTLTPGSPGLRDVTNSYNWYDPNPATNGGDAGSTGTATSCNNTLAACNTHDYVIAVNAASLCGRSDWRLPSYRDAFTLFNAQTLGAVSPTPFDATYFLLRGNVMFTSNTVIGNTSNAWYVSSNGMDFRAKSSAPRQVRLVAGTNAFQ